MTSDAGWRSPRQDGVELRVRAVPGASRPGIAGLLGDRLKIRVAEPPEEGRANAAIERLLADRLGIHPRDISIAAGHASRDKTVHVRGVDETALDRLLSG
jgi:uncharacterized protein (TIGR00251 family)